MEQDEEIFREFMEEEERKEQELADKIREEKYLEKRRLFAENGIEDMLEEEPYNRIIPQQLLGQNNPYHPTQESVILGTQEQPPTQDSASATSKIVSDKGKAVDTATSSPTETPKKRKNMNKWMEKAYVDGVRIYHKNRGRSERIKNLQMSKAYQFDQQGSGSIPDKAFAVSDSE